MILVLSVNFSPITTAVKLAKIKYISQLVYKTWVACVFFWKTSKCAKIFLRCWKHKYKNKLKRFAKTYVI